MIDTDTLMLCQVGYCGSAGSSMICVSFNPPPPPPLLLKGTTFTSYLILIVLKSVKRVMEGKVTDYI